MIKQKLTIEGMSCNHCVMAVKKELGNISGLSIVDVTVGSARIERDPALVSVARMNAAVEEAGFRVLAVEDE
jgi:copper chaperone